jgi:hypothetical protein
MSLTLHDAFVPTAKQILGGLTGLVDKAESHCAETGCTPDTLIDARLAETMWPLPWHVRSCWVHSGYAIEQFESGVFSPDFTDIPGDWDAMRAMIADTLTRLDAVSPDYLDAIADKPVDFVLGGKTLMTMTGQDFLLSFSQPNFFFHATTFYDILRMQGVALGKRDFLGIPRIIAA